MHPHGREIKVCGGAAEKIRIVTDEPQREVAAVAEQTANASAAGELAGAA
jgi:hypothetical protein